MLHLLDASVLITAHRSYYALDRVPEFWEWLVHHGSNGNVKMPVEMVEEIQQGNDKLAVWIADEAHLGALRFDEEANVGLVQHAINFGYAKDLADHEVDKIGRDPFLVSYALGSPTNRCVVTSEVSKPNLQRANRRVPDVCQSLQVSWMNSFGLLKAPNFSTSWKASS